MDNFTEQHEYKKIKKQGQDADGEIRVASQKIDDENTTPGIMNRSKEPVEQIVNCLKGITEDVIDFFAKKVERDERIEMSRMRIDYKAFIHRYWACLILCTISIISLVIFAITNTGQSLNVVLGMIIGATITFITKDASIISRQKEAKNMKYKDD
jgi:hypothetical protein